jgi:hypothetical protein
MGSNGVLSCVATARLLRYRPSSSSPGWTLRLIGLWEEPGTGRFPRRLGHLDRDASGFSSIR